MWRSVNHKCIIYSQVSLITMTPNQKDLRNRLQLTFGTFDMCFCWAKSKKLLRIFECLFKGTLARGSRLLINFLKYFKFWFRVCRDPRPFMHSKCSQYTNRFISRIWQIRIAKFRSRIYLTPCLLHIRVCTGSFHVSSV